MRNPTQNIQQEINNLIKSLSQTKGLILTYPILVEFFDGDHKAAIFTNQILYWTDRTNDPEGWFYKTYDEWEAEIQFSYYQVQRVIFGDERVQNPKRNLSDVGLETQVKMAPNGRNATFYRLDIAQFVGMLVEWLEKRFGDFTHWLKSKFQREPQPETVPSADTAPSWLNDFSDHDFVPFPFGKAEPEKPIVPTERVSLPWDGGLHTGDQPSQTIADAWSIARELLKNQFDDNNFYGYIKPMQLVDYDAATTTFTFAVPQPHQADTLNHRLNRHISRILSDMFGQTTTIVSVSHKDWYSRRR